MNDSRSNKILATINAEDFIGRARETEALRRHANDDDKSRGLLLLSAPAAGASELLKQFFDQFFQEQNETIPFYFAVKESDKTAKNCAARFLQTFIAQSVAFRQQDARIIAVAPDIGELAALAALGDNYWIDRLVAVCRMESQSNDERAFIRDCLSAPLRAAAYGANSLVIIDNLHEAEYLSGDIDFIEEIKEIFSRSTISFVLAGNRRFLLRRARTGNIKLTGAKNLPVESLGFAGAGLLAENLAARYAVKINEQTRDLIARKFQGNPALIKFTLQAAREKQTDLDSFRRVEQVYTDELFGGRIGKFYDSLLEKIAPAVETQKEIVRFFYGSLTTGDKQLPIEAWTKRLEENAQQTSRAISLLNTHEIIRLSSNQIEAMEENEVLSDYMTARFRLEMAAENRAAVVGETLSDFLKRAPQTMAKFYRQKSVVNLRDLLAHFNQQETPLYLIDYSLYKEWLKELELVQEAAQEPKKIRLPQIIYTAHTAAFYPPFAQVTEKMRSVVALGFNERAYTVADETIWIAAEIDSKLEASPEKAEFWCDRLEMVALMCNFPKYKIWLVAPEGFAPEAIEILKQRNAFGSSRRQVELLMQFLQADAPIPSEKTAASEYEIVLPMGEDTELIAANAVEEIARHHQFAPKAINQIKTALVEACINATEHSLSPDRKIHQKIAVEEDRIVITISNRGLRIADKRAEESTPAEGRRGWGLKLIKTLMDEVKFEQVDDGTRISMTKYLK